MNFWKRRLLVLPVLMASLFMPLGGVHAASFIDPSDTNILYTGRMDLSNPSEPNFSWSGTSIIANFEGTSISGSFSSESGEDNLYVIIDDQVDVNNRTILNLSSNQQTFVLASGLSNGTHKVEIVKMTESWDRPDNQITFYGLELDNGSALVSPPARPPLKIEFYGDSNTAGYSALCGCDNGDNAYSDSYFAYPAMTSRLLDAEYSSIAVSGAGIKKPKPAMPSRYTRTHWGESSPTWDFTSWTPDVVVINLGANDHYFNLSQSQMIQAWKDFVTNDLRSHYPNAHIVFNNGYGWDFGEPADFVDIAVADLHAAGDTNVSYILMPWLWGGQHAVICEHAGFANKLAAHIAAELGLSAPGQDSLSCFGENDDVANGNLEDSSISGEISGWRSWGSNAAYIENAPDAHSGSDYALVAGTSSGFWHANPVTPGSQYTVSGYLRGNGVGHLAIEFKDQGQGVITATSTPVNATGTWTQTSTVATAPANAWSVTISLSIDSGDVDFDTISLLKGSGGGDTTAPNPDPMTWASVPAASGTSISMTATTATDASGVEYSFTNLTVGGHDSGWQSSPSYTDTGLAASTTYNYQVQARDLSANQNATGSSSVAGATTDGGGCTASTMSVSSIVPATQGVGQGKKIGKATVTVVDYCGAPVSGVTVSGTFTGDYNESRSAVTNGNGVAVVETTATAKGNVSFTFCVDNVSGGSLTYDSGDNAETCDSN